MKSWAETVYNTGKVFLFFMGFTFLFYYGIVWVHQEYQDYHKYDEPQGSAVKVANMGHEEKSTSWIDRLLLFYQNGE
ncbi:YqzK family protein [Priestia koreensis]|uniref:YqzK family protein n=1 Tax=Priestia koreensis TaxID=284581 RepID=UPI001F579EA9|nr:YqzK family protein [Priestia koreensis]UNL84088.1 YqzK family protein [Priestia koreensis]